MKKGDGKIIAVVLVILAIIMIIVGIVASSYNGLIRKSEEVDNKFATIDIMLQRRVDLIPNLVNTVKGFTTQEKEVLELVTEARAKLAGAGNISEKATADSELNSAISKLLVVVENYPEIKSSQNFIQLSDELAGTENRIATSRKDYNDSVTSYNVSVKKFPTNLLAGMFNFKEKQYFIAKEGSNEVPTVEF